MNDILSTNECAQILKAMADETRLLIIRSLFCGEKSGTELALELELPQSHIAHHLGILKNASLLESKRNGKKVDYRLSPIVLESLKQSDETAINLGCCKVSFNPEAEDEEN